MKNKAYIFLVLILAIIVLVSFFAARNAQTPRVNVQNTADNIQNSKNNDQYSSSADVKIQKSETLDPLPGALARITKKPFGIYITPKTSPVQPERFQGFHTGIDLETTAAEQQAAVPVQTLCAGKLLLARAASGHGGVVVQSCVLDSQAVAVIYGHLDLASMKSKVGDELPAGTFLANLGQGFSSQTDGERKHLHLAIHKGTAINILGYVQNKSELIGWLDPAAYLQ